MAMSRLDAGMLSNDVPNPRLIIGIDFFTKNLHYSTNWWEEHSTNFGEMIQKILTAENVFKLVATSSLMVLQFNTKSGWISEKDNDVIEAILSMFSTCRHYCEI